MKNLKVIKIENDEIEFENGVKLYSRLKSDYYDYHYLCMDALTIEDFEELRFDLTNDNFFKRIDAYGIELIPVRGYSVKIPAYGLIGYYSEQVNLILTDDKEFKKEYDITECQVVKY